MVPTDNINHNFPLEQVTSNNYKYTGKDTNTKQIFSSFARSLVRFLLSLGSRNHFLCGQHNNSANEKFLLGAFYLT